MPAVYIFRYLEKIALTEQKDTEDFIHMRWHFIGIGGIGMSGLAQMAVHQGIEVTGSDRDSTRPENRRILDKLEAQGIRIYPQDGSFMTGPAPDKLIYSTAVEEGNPDFVAGEGIARLHRAEALDHLIRSGGFEHVIAVTGSCGKSTVTSYLAETLLNCGEDPDCLNGALCNRFRSGVFAGNYRPGNGKYFVFEADESDKSLLRYTPDYALVLNIGTDHYDKAELQRVFGTFLQRVRKGAVLSSEIAGLLNGSNPALETKVFASGIGGDGDYAVKRSNGLEAVFADGSSLVLPQPGDHMALNALAVLAMMEMLGFRREDVLNVLPDFGGVWRRFDRHGKTPGGAAVYDDYAHNPEKIASAVRAAQCVATGSVYAVFQPHGFGPLGFMRKALFSTLQEVLKREDRFLMLEPFYAGGTTSFKPTSQEVVSGYREAGGTQFLHMADRKILAEYLLRNAGPGDVILIMGARDNSLSDFASSLAQ